MRFLGLYHDMPKLTNQIALFQINIYNLYASQRDVQVQTYTVFHKAVNTVATPKSLLFLKSVIYFFNFLAMLIVMVEH